MRKGEGDVEEKDERNDVVQWQCKKIRKREKKRGKVTGKKDHTKEIVQGVVIMNYFFLQFFY